MMAAFGRFSCTTRYSVTNNSSLVWRSAQSSSCKYAELNTAGQVVLSVSDSVWVARGRQEEALSRSELKGHRISPAPEHLKACSTVVSFLHQYITIWRPRKIFFLSGDASPPFRALD
jgi:hypothetical protein